MKQFIDSMLFEGVPDNAVDANDLDIKFSGEFPVFYLFLKVHV